jgi:FlaA1/EpsC-like NDP-sugar epimerase
MEDDNAWAALRNNTLGTYHAALAAAEVGVERFVLISTDKAVNPTNVMGATKRAAEMVISAMAAEHSGTRFIAVRFGNVLGSSGSVIPKFKEQIAKGGPVTVTHPEIIRYFMTIPEAARLVLQAAAIGESGQVLVLDMGEPVKIVDLLRITKTMTTDTSHVRSAISALIGESLHGPNGRSHTQAGARWAADAGWQDARRSGQGSGRRETDGVYVEGTAG